VTTHDNGDDDGGEWDGGPVWMEYALIAIAGGALWLIFYFNDPR
jgi:hypothetical protein